MKFHQNKLENQAYHACLLIFLAFISTGNLFSQIIITDTNNNPIPYVQVTNNNSVFAQSNLKGAVEGVDFHSLSSDDTLFFHHVSYKKISKTKKDLIGVDTIRLQQQTYELREIPVVSTQGRKKYIKINACYRSFQVNNDSIAYYSDGKVVYLGKVKRQKYKFFPKDYRVFTRNNIQNETPQRSIGLTFNMVGVPWLSADYFPSNYVEKHDLVFVVRNNENIDILNKDVLVGKIEISPEYVKYSINDIYSIRSRKAFKTEVKTISSEIIMVFRNIKSVNATSIKSFDDLVFMKTIRELHVKHDKDKDFMKILDVDELFIEDVSYTEDQGNEEYIFAYGMPKSSNYDAPFWRSCNCNVYYPPDEQMLHGLQER